MSIKSSILQSSGNIDKEWKELPGIEECCEMLSSAYDMGTTAMKS